MSFFTQTMKRIRLLLPLPLFGKKKLMLAFEYGLNIRETATGMKMEITPELVARAEHILLNECKRKSATDVACMMVPNLLAAFEPKEDN